MTCAEVREEFSALMDGELAPELRAAVEAHIAQCSECLRELDALKRIDALYRGLPRQFAPEGFEESVRNAIHAAAPASPRLRLLPRLVALAAVAAMLLVVFGGVVLRSQMSEKALKTASLLKEDKRLKEQFAKKLTAAPEIPKETVEQLKALGYMQEKGAPASAPLPAPAAPAAPASTPLPEPKKAEPAPPAVLEPMELSKRAPMPGSATPALKADAVKSKLLYEANDAQARSGADKAESRPDGSIEAGGAPAAAVSAEQAAPIRASQNAARRYMEKGDALLARGELDGASSSYRSAVSLAPQNVEALTKLGDVLLRQGKNEEALGRFTVAAHAEPRNTAALCGLGRALALLGRTDDAVQQFRKALEVAEIASLRSQ